MKNLKFKLFGSTLLALSLTAAAAATEPSNDADWSELRYEAKSMWATALTKLTLATQESAKFGQVQHLQLDGSVAKNTEREIILLAPDSGAVLERERFTRGKNQRLKQYTYAVDSVTRVRREPSANDTSPAQQWPISSQKKLKRPSSQECPVLTVIPALLKLAQTVSGAPDKSLTTCVHSDNNFYRVQMEKNGEEQLKVNYSLAEGKVSGKKATDVITVKVKRVGTPDGDMDFSLLGLSSPVVILVGKESGLPIQVRGKAPRIGDTQINLIAATLTPPATEQAR
jgi:hypothetical protein